MSRIRIIKKNDEYSQEYEVGDVLRQKEPGTGSSYFRENRSSGISG